MELGGKAAALVLEAGDLELAARGSVFGGFNHHGPTCFSTERVIITTKIYDEFIAVLKQAAARFPTTGAVGTSGARRARRVLTEAVQKGAARVRQNSLSIMI